MDKRNDYALMNLIPWYEQMSMGHTHQQQNDTIKTAPNRKISAFIFVILDSLY